MTSRTALALAPLALLVACKPDPAIAHRRAGDDLMGQADFAGAAAEYARSLDLDPKQPKVWEKLAFCRVKTGEKDLAADSLARMAQLQPDAAKKAEAYRNAAGIFLQGADQEKAEKYLLEAVRLDPADEASLTWLGELASVKGGARLQDARAVPAELDKALGYYARLLELRPDSRNALANRRIALVKYLDYLADEKRMAGERLRKSGRDAQAAAAAKERIASLDARTADLRRLLDETTAKLGAGRKPAGR